MDNYALWNAKKQPADELIVPSIQQCTLHGVDLRGMLIT
ncbi:Hypothetical protein LOCK908_2369 [Lacticaseibacillus rhamnosus LOCK908]|nr:conserved hypothetical protein [Lacticaseibacillus rhamnosus ATCC 8530]AGP74990.1 Hypothetical protein LOCK908_2369 [Lacticaseibacillus rhamnosus LOCK908]